MYGKLVLATLMLAVPATSSGADRTGASLPASVAALSGCWQGRGEVNGKPVAIFVAAYPIVQNAMLAIEAASSAIADPDDQYAAHLVLGGAIRSTGAGGDRIVGYWADSFGGAFAAAGQGESRTGGFDITYRYPDGDFVNHWRISGATVRWQIIRRDATGIEKAFADYRLQKATCRASAGG